MHSISAYMMLLTMDVLIAESSCYIYISVDYNGRHAISYLPNKNAKWPINFILNGHFDRSNKLKHITWMVLFKKHNSKRRNTNIFLALPWQSTKSCYKFMVPDHCQYHADMHNIWKQYPWDQQLDRHLSDSSEIVTIHTDLYSASRLHICK